ncbi:type II toxin-antitoxin system HipA family toxin [Stutzerimonas stutzeri]|uniref:type II toxin-antitoxin system HipA family toxin n=1 Tax=Stutzerimonas stutzeri TaxID=316 RepID=UPI0015E32082|nr:type II toxin-antitoxin system HipA family toxin [Stutzerimonas stutzeri]MBA1280256.1 type II toxin-antitoxin system HipA family toxin [Stutzerimonas stutzeri]
MADTLRVYTNTTAVGRLGRFNAPAPVASNGSLFSYHDDVADHDAIALAMPVTWQPYQWERGLHPIFEMNMPEGVLRDVLMRRFSKAVRGFDDFALLSVVGPHQLGRVRVSSTGYLEASPQGQSVTELLIHDGTKDLFNDLLSTYAAYSGVSGVQPKVLLRDADADMDRVTHKGASHIIKTWRDGEYNELAVNEYLCMQAAKHAGIPVPEVQLSATGKLLAVKRFDLLDQGYLGHEDFCVMSGFSTGQKYDGSYEGIARLIKAYVSPERIGDSLLTYFKLVALNAGIQNGDAHLKNFGVLYSRGGPDADVWLAPAYDLVSTTPYIPRDSLALTLGGSKAWPKEKALTKFGRTACGLSEITCLNALEQVADGIAVAYDELQGLMDREPSFMSIGTAMQAAWNAGVARSLVSESRPTHYPGLRRSPRLGG